MFYIKIAEHIIKVIDHDSASFVEDYCHGECEGNCNHDHECGHDHSKDTLVYFMESNYDQVEVEEDTAVDFTIHLREQGYGEPFQNYDVAITENENGKMYKRADYCIEINSAFTDVNVYAHNPFALKHAMLNIYSAYIVQQNWGLLMHSSCVVDDEEARIFTGHSGAGKSTAAKLSEPRPLLSDEASILCITEEGVTIYHSPFRSELIGRAEKDVYPLKDIHLLYQATMNKQVPMTSLKAYLALIDKVFYWTNNPDEMAKVMRLLKQLTTHVPVYELYFEKNPSFWEVMA